MRGLDNQWEDKPMRGHDDQWILFNLFVANQKSRSHLLTIFSLVFNIKLHCIFQTLIKYEFFVALFWQNPQGYYFISCTDFTCFTKFLLNVHCPAQKDIKFPHVKCWHAFLKFSFLWPWKNIDHKDIWFPCAMIKYDMLNLPCAQPCMNIDHKNIEYPHGYIWHALLKLTSTRSCMNIDH